MNQARMAMPNPTLTLPFAEDAPDYTKEVAGLTFRSQGETFACAYYASNHVKVSHPELGFLVESVTLHEQSLMKQVERLASALLERRAGEGEPSGVTNYEGAFAFEGMDMATASLQSKLALGCDFREFGDYASGSLSERNAWAISAGMHEHSPSSWVKGDSHYPNEDGLLLAEQGDISLLAIADAHFGLQPSHTLLRDLALLIDPLPRTREDLRNVLQRLAERKPEHDEIAGTSLLVTVYDRSSRSGFGFSFADSTFALVGSSGHRIPISRREAGFAYLSQPDSLHPEMADAFDYLAEPGDLLLLYTDGINECHYREPATSVTPADMERLHAQLGADGPLRYLQALVELALAGVNGNPGGEDNIAAIAVRA